MRELMCEEKKKRNKDRKKSTTQRKEKHACVQASKQEKNPNNASRKEIGIAMNTNKPHL